MKYSIIGKISFIVITIILSGSINLTAQKEIKSFIFGHSLIHHEFQVNPTPSQETSVPHWFHFLSLDAGYSYKVSGQYGFLPQHANLPPIAQWGFDFVPGAWDSDTEPFSEADFTNILITPANFIQWQAPNINYPNETISPIDATIDIIDWCAQQEDSLDFFIYENWPDLAPYLNNGFPPSPSEWNAYLEYLNGDFHNWFLEYYEAIQSQYPNACVKMIPVGPIINNVMRTAPYDQIPIDELYEDDAPHGRTNIYFLASMVTYMAMYEEKPPLQYIVDNSIHPIIQDNYENLVHSLWDDLLAYKDAQGDNLAFCSESVSTSTEVETNREISIYPNPTNGFSYT